MSWIETKYPIGREVEAVDQSDSLQAGTIANHTEERDVTNGIVVRFEDGTYNEFEASFLDEGGNGPFVHDRGWRPVGRPKERKGKYVVTALEIREDLLLKLDRQRGNRSRREVVEQLLEAALASRGPEA